MHIHTVYFWLKPEVDEEAKSNFEEGLRFLMKCKTIKEGRWGSPADTHREVVDRSYDYGITLFFETLYDHNIYQQDEDHMQFVKGFSHLWERVQVYDVETGA